MDVRICGSVDELGKALMCRRIGLGLLQLRFAFALASAFYFMHGQPENPKTLEDYGSTYMYMRWRHMKNTSRY